MKTKGKVEKPVLKAGEVYVVVRKGEVLKVRRYWSDAAGWQKQLAGSSIEVRRASEVQKPARAAAAKKVKATKKAKAVVTKVRETKEAR